MHWILLIALNVGYGGSLATATFDDREACLAAGQIAKQTFRETPTFVCVPSGKTSEATAASGR